MNKQTRIYKAVAARVVGHFKTQADLARCLGYSDRRNVTNWANGTVPFPPHHCVSIERMTNGQITRQELRPFDWSKFWPELAVAES